MTCSSLPYIECRTKNGKIIKILLDTGSSKNYIQPNLVLKPLLNEQPFFANSIAGKIEITHHTLVNLFGKNDTNLKFFLLPTLNSFHGILGNDSLRDMSAIINIHDNTLKIGYNTVIKIKQKFSADVNKINIGTEHMTLQQKYDRHPPKPEIQATPIPQSPGEIVHIDIYSTEKRFILTSVDKYSKYAQVKIIPSRAVEHIKDPIRELMIAFGIPKLVVIDNEKSLNSASISSLLKDQMNIEVYVTPPYASTTNGQVERFHSTLSEIMRCLKSDNNSLTFEELLFKSVKEYNSTIHSTTKKKPLETFFGTRVTTDPQELERHRQQNIELLTKKQIKDLGYHNKNRKKTKDYSVGEEIFVKINKRLGSKLSSRYKKEIVAENKRTTVKTQSGRTVHKSNIRS